MEKHKPTDAFEIHLHSCSDNVVHCGCDDKFNFTLSAVMVLAPVYHVHAHALD